MITQDANGEPYEPFGFTPRQRFEWNNGVDLHGQDAMMRTLPSRGDNTAGFMESWWAYAATDLWMADLLTDTLSGNASSIPYGTNPTLKGLGKIATSLFTLPIAALDPFHTQEQYKKTVDDAYYSAVYTVTKLFGDTPVKPMSMEEAFLTIPDELKDHPDTISILRLADQVGRLESAGHRKAMVASWLSEAQNRSILERTPWYNALLVGLLSLPVDLSAWADLFLTNKLMKAGIITREVVGSATKHYGKTVVAGMATGAVSGTAREYLLWQGQELRTVEMAVQAVAVETVLGGFIGAGMEFMGHAWTRSAARRASSESTGGAIDPQLPVPTVEDLRLVTPLSRSSIEVGFIDNAYAEHGVGDLGGNTWIKDEYRKQLSKHKRDSLETRRRLRNDEPEPSVTDEGDRLWGEDPPEQATPTRPEPIPLEQAWEWTTLTVEEWAIWDAKVRNMIARHTLDGVNFARPFLQEGNQPGLPGMSDPTIEADAAIRLAEVEVFQGIHAAENSIMLKKLEQVEGMAAQHIANGLTLESMTAAWEAAGGSLDPDDPSTEALRRLLDNYTLERTAVVLNAGEVEMGDLLSVRGRSSSGRETLVADPVTSSDEPLTPAELDEYFRTELGSDSQEYEILEPYLEHVRDSGDKVSVRDVAILFSDANGGSPLKINAAVEHWREGADWVPIGTESGKKITVTIEPNLDHPLFETDLLVSPLDRYKGTSTVEYTFSMQKKPGAGGATDRVILLEDVKYHDSGARKQFDADQSTRAVRSGVRLAPDRRRYEEPNARRQRDKISMRKALGEYAASTDVGDWKVVRLANLVSGRYPQHAAGEYDPHHMWAKEFRYRRLRPDEGTTIDLKEASNWDTGGGLRFSDIHSKYTDHVPRDARLVVEAKVHNNKGNEAFFGDTPNERVVIYLDEDGYVVGFIDGKGKARVEHLGKHHQEVITDANGADPGSHSSSEIDSMLGDHILPDAAEVANIVEALSRGRVQPRVILKPRKVKRFATGKTHTGAERTVAVLDQEHLDDVMDPVALDADMVAANPLKIETRDGDVDIGHKDNVAFEAFHRLQARIHLLLGLHTGGRTTELRALTWDDLEVVTNAENELVSATLRLPDMKGKEVPARMKRVYRFSGENLAFIKKLLEFKELESDRIDYFAGKVGENGEVPQGGKYYHLAKEIKDQGHSVTRIGDGDTPIIRSYTGTKKGGVLQHGYDLINADLRESPGSRSVPVPLATSWKMQKQAMADLLSETSTRDRSGRGVRWTRWNKTVKGSSNEPIDITRRTILNLARNSLDIDSSGRQYYETVVRAITGHAEPPKRVEGADSTFTQSYQQEYENKVKVRREKEYKHTPAVVQQVHEDLGRLPSPEYSNSFESGAIGVLSSKGAGPGYDLDALRDMAVDELNEVRDSMGDDTKKQELFRKLLDVNIRIRLESMRPGDVRDLRWGDVELDASGRADVKITYVTSKTERGRKGGKRPKTEYRKRDAVLRDLLVEARTLDRKKDGFNEASPVLGQLRSTRKLSKYTALLGEGAWLNGLDDNVHMEAALHRGLVSSMPSDVQWSVKRTNATGADSYVWVDNSNATLADTSQWRDHADQTARKHYTSDETLWAKVPLPPRRDGKKNYRSTTQVMREVRALHQTLWELLEERGVQLPSIEDYLDLTLDASMLSKMLDNPVLRNRYDRGSWEPEGVPLVTNPSRPGYDSARIGAVMTEVRRDIKGMHHIRTMDDLVNRTKTVYSKRKGVEVPRVTPKVHYTNIARRMDTLAGYSSELAAEQKARYTAWHEAAQLREGVVESSVTGPRDLRKARHIGDPETRYETTRTVDSLEYPLADPHNKILIAEEQSVSVERFKDGGLVSTGLKARSFTQGPSYRTQLIDRKDDLFSTRDGEVRALFRFNETLGNIIIAMKNPNAKDALEEVFHHIDVTLLKKTVPLEMRGGVTDEMIDALDQFAGNRTSVEGRERLAKAFIDFANNNRAPDEMVYTVFERVMRFLRRLFRVVETHPGRDMEGVMTPEVRAAFSQILQRRRLTSPAEIQLRNAIASRVVDPNDPTQCANALLLINRNAQSQRQLLDDHSAAGILLPREEQELLDLVLTGATPEMIELFGARVGTIAGKLVRSMMFLTPGSRLLASENASAQNAALLLTNTGIILDGNGVRTGSSLDRMHTGLTNDSLEVSMRYQDLATKNISEGGILTVAEFDRLLVIAEQFLAPDEAIPKDFHLMTPELGVRGEDGFVESRRIETFTGDELSDADLVNLEEARAVHREALNQQDVFLDTTGVRLLSEVEDIRKFYREVYGESVFHRVFDTGLIVENYNEVVDAVMHGWKEYHDHMVGKGWEEGQPPNVDTPEGIKLQRIEEAITETEADLSRLHEPGRNTTKANDREYRKTAAKLNRLATKDKPRQVAEMKALEPDRDKAMGIVSQWGRAPLSIVDQSWLGVSTAPTSTVADQTRSILISDKWLMPYLKHSGSEQAVQFGKRQGIQGLSVSKLGRSDQKKFINNTKRLLAEAKEIEEKMQGIEAQHRDPAATDTIEIAIPELNELKSKLEDISDEITVTTDIQMIVTDAHLMPTQGEGDLTPEALVSFVNEIEELGRVRRDMIKEYRSINRELNKDDAGLNGLNALTAEEIDAKKVLLGELRDAIKANADSINEKSAGIGKRGGNLGEFHVSERVRGAARPDAEGTPSVQRDTTQGTDRGFSPATRLISEFEGYEDLGSGAVRVHEEIHTSVARSAAIRKKGGREISNTVQVINSLEHLAAGIHRDTGSRYRIGDGTELSAKGLREQAHLDSSLRVIHDRLHGNHNKVSKHSPPWLRYTLKNVRNLVYSMSMGAVVRSSVPDMASTAAVQGFGPSLVAFSKVAKRHMTSMLSRGADDPEARGFDRTMYAMEATLGNYRQTALNAIETHRPLHSIGAVGKSPGERVTDATAALARTTSTFSGITRWNGFWKEVNTLAAMDHMIRMGKDLRDGKTPSDWDLRYVARAGLTDADLKKISMLSERFGRVEQTALGGEFAWSGEYLWSPMQGIDAAEVGRLRNEFKASMHTMAELAVLSPDAGNVPGLADSTDAGSMITQFKKFFMIATVNVSMPMMQRTFAGDPRVMTHIASMAMLGGMVYWWSSAARGVDPIPAIASPEQYTREQWWNNVAQVVYEAIDRSGMMGIFSELLNLSERLGVGPSVAFGGEGLSRSKSRPIGQIVLGPAAGKMEEAGIVFHNAVKAMFTSEPISPSALRSGRRLLPLNNLLPFSMVFDQGHSMLGGYEARNRYTQDFGSRNVGDHRDFYYHHFRWAEHRLADMVGLDVDYSNWHPGRKVGL